MLKYRKNYQGVPLSRAFDFVETLKKESKVYMNIVVMGTAFPVKVEKIYGGEKVRFTMLSNGYYEDFAYNEVANVDRYLSSFILNKVSLECVVTV